MEWGEGKRVKGEEVEAEDRVSGALSHNGSSNFVQESNLCVDAESQDYPFQITWQGWQRCTPCPP